MLGTVAPLRDDQGVLTGWMGIAADLTARKQVEAEREQLIRDAERLGIDPYELRLRNGIESGYVTASEWTRYDLQSDLIVLSACETGVGRIVQGEGVTGLPFALYVAGNRNTLLSLWPVVDESTAEFMGEFFRRLRAGESSLIDGSDLPVHLLEGLDRDATGELVGQLVGSGGPLDEETGAPLGYFMQTAEKTYASFTLTARNAGGHSSLPRAAPNRSIASCA